MASRLAILLVMLGALRLASAQTASCSNAPVLTGSNAARSYTGSIGQYTAPWPTNTGSVSGGVKCLTWQYTPTFAGTLYMTTCGGTSDDTVMMISSGSCVNNFGATLNQLNDDGCNRQSIVSLAATVNTRYFLHLCKYSSNITVTSSVGLSDGQVVFDVQCPVGTTDHDSLIQTPCVSCPAGSFVPFGSRGACSAFLCTGGTSDADNSSATACVACGAGTDTSSPGNAGPCSAHNVPAGSYDHDSNSATAAITCPPGNYAPAAGTTCTTCGTETWDHDSSSATACTSCTSACSAGSFQSQDCTPTSNRICTSCTSPFYGDATNLRCVTTCPEGTYPHDDTRMCNPECPSTWYFQGSTCVASCAPNFADPVSRLCVANCTAPNYFGDASRTCVTPCPNGTYGNPFSAPRVCVSACTGGYYAEPTSKLCVQTCPAGTYGDGLRTPPSCVASCTSGTFKDNATRSCVSACPVNEWADPSTSSCASSCSSGLFKQSSNGFCVAECAGGLFADPSSGLCVAVCPLPTYGNSLASPPSCSSSCTGGRFKDDSTQACVAHCPAALWADPSTSSCAASCSSGLFSQNATWSCVDICTVGFADNGTQTCVSRCPSGLFANPLSHTCATTCPSGYQANQQTNSCDEGSSSRAHNAGGSSPAAAAAGAAAAGVVVLIAIVAVLLIVRRRKRSRNNLRMDKSPATIEMTTPGVASGRQKHNSNDSAKVVASQTQQDKSRPASASHSVPAGSGNANTDYSTPLKATSKSTSGPASTTVDPSTAYSIAVVSTAALLSSQIATGTRKLLGRGNFGQVFSANVSIALIAPQHRHLFAPGAQTVDVAVKTLLLDANARAEQDFVLEAELLRKLNHTNIVNVLAVLPAGRGQPQMLVLEYVPYGDLRNLLRQSAKCDVAWSPEEYVHVATGIAAGMGYLEQARVLHRDLAARNVLVGSHLVAKIADFGLSRELNDKDYYKLQSKQKLPVRWMAPETLNYRKFSSQSDVFSYGVVLWELFTMGQPPWADVERDQYLVGLKRGDRLPQPPTCPAQLYSLMLATWEWDPSARPSFADCVGLLQPLRPPRGSVRDLGALVRGRSNTNG